MIIQNSPFYKPNQSVKVADDISKDLSLAKNNEPQNLNE